MLFLLILSLVIVASVAALFSPYIFVRILGGIVLGVILYIVCLIFWPVIKMSPRLLSAILFMNGMFTLDAILCQTMLGFWRTWNSIFVKLGFPEEHEELRGWYTQIASNSVMLGEFEKASSMNRKCLEIAMRDGTVADVGEARVNLAYILLKTGELEESSQLMKKGLADVEREYNRHVRELDDVQDDFSRNSDDEEAYMLETGVTVAKLDLEQIKLRLYTCLYSYGDFLETFLLFDKAVEVRKRAFEIARDCFPDGQKGLEYALTQLGICLARVGNLEEAEKRIKEGFELLKRGLGLVMRRPQQADLAHQAGVALAQGPHRPGQDPANDGQRQRLIRGCNWAKPRSIGSKAEVKVRGASGGRASRLVMMWMV